MYVLFVVVRMCRDGVQLSLGRGPWPGLLQGSGDA